MEGIFAGSLLLTVLSFIALISVIYGGIKAGYIAMYLKEMRDMMRRAERVRAEAGQLPQGNASAGGDQAQS